ncbi:MAG TPA: hypothetical protein VIE88_05100 [Vicinamibacteria bacterium]
MHEAYVRLAGQGAPSWKNRTLRSWFRGVGVAPFGGKLAPRMKVA